MTGAPAVSVDLNSDVGEGFGPWRMGDDDALIDVVTTVSVACGLHAGDPLIMARTVARAAERGVRVGAHPGPYDLWGFGRRPVDTVRPSELCSLVVYQVGALAALATREGTRVSHVKLHGALSNAAAVDPVLARAIAEALHGLDASLAWLVPAGCEMASAGTAVGLRVVSEVFADRAYDDNADLVPRTLPGAVIDDPPVVAARALAMVRNGGILSAAGRHLALAVESICVHGDTPNAVLAARAVRAELEQAGVRVAAFC